jgi:hypothetical protein
VLWSCEIGGNDASYLYDCSTIPDPLSIPISANNPLSCYTTLCTGAYAIGNGGPGCCRYQKPLCQTNWTSLTGYDAVAYWPYAIMGSNPTITFPINFQVCTPPNLGSQFHADANVYNPMTSNAVYLSVTFLRSSYTVGQTIPWASGVGMLNLAGAGGCSDWTGTVTWVSDVPNWGLGFNLTCSGKPGITVVGTLTGSE